MFVVYILHHRITVERLLKFPRYGSWKSLTKPHNGLKNIEINEKERIGGDAVKSSEVK